MFELSVAIHNSCAQLATEAEEHVTTWGGRKLNGQPGIVVKFFEFHVAMYA